MKRESENNGTITKPAYDAPTHQHDEWVAFFNAIDEVFFTVDMINQKVLSISDACERLFGYKRSNFLSSPGFWISLVHPDDKHIINAEEKLLQKGKRVSNEYRINCKDGSIKWVENRIVPYLDDRGILSRIDGVTRDITEQKAAREKYLEGETRFRRIVEAAQEGIWTIDDQEKTNFVNQKMADILGYTPEEMIGKGLYDFMDEEGKAYAIACMERRRRGSKENLDIRYKTKNGDDVWANISANPVFDENGVYKGALAMVTDITQRKFDEDALKKSEANLRTIFENTDTAYVLFDTDLTIISFNALAQKYSEEQNGKSLVVNKPISDYFTPERWPFIKETVDKVARGITVSYELSSVKSDGSVRWNDVRWLNVKDDNGETRGFILVNQDRTEAKLAALERERITSDLIQHNKDLEQFTYIISHNLRAPVANIIALSEMLNEAGTDSNTKEEVIERISKSIQNVDTVIQDLNHILQARDTVNEKRENVYFRELIDTIRASIYNTIVSEQVEFKYDFEEAKSIFTVRSYIYSIFYNLTSNSIKYRKPGIPPVISIKSHHSRNKIELRFRDNGKGIDMSKYAAQVFGLYKRFDHSVEGKGMGLFMVKTQVEALGGSIRIKSKPGEGTEFVIQLPLQLS
ncbi:MAG TPA: PAS domain-containing sensor histidine kinase [Mucilaginibacter sp.]|nr:PAS domain-containing sensor histidine kinase [Mucilaginibacter sp.]